jgi:hypothetical protein
LQKKTEWLVEGSGVEWSLNHDALKPGRGGVDTPAGSSADSMWDDEDSMVEGSGSVLLHEGE